MLVLKLLKIDLKIIHYYSICIKLSVESIDYFLSNRNLISNFLKEEKSTYYAKTREFTFFNNLVKQDKYIFT